MKKTAIILATVAAFGLTAIASTSPAEARHGIGPGLIGGAIAGAAIAGAASSAYAWSPRSDYGAYGGYDDGRGYYGRNGYYDRSYSGYGDQSQHGGQSSY